jgi:hypothetical protein
VRKLFAIACASVAAAAIAGSAVAANRSSHVMNVPLPDGSTARIEYVGDIAPKVTVTPGRPLAAATSGWMPMPSFAGFDGVFEQMNRETEAMIRQAQQMAAQHAVGGPTPYVASFGNAPAGVSSSTTIVSYSNGTGTCTRTTETVSQGAGKPPKVTTSVSGDCGSHAAPQHAPPASSAPLSNT